MTPSPTPQHPRHAHLAATHAPATRESVAVVSGASRGLGLLISTELARRGFNLALIARTPAELTEAQETLRREFPSLRIETYPCDVSDRPAIQRIVEDIETNFGPIEVLLNVAGIIQVGPAENATEELFDQAISGMLLGPINLTWAVLPHMRKRRAGRIGTVSSIGGAIAVPHLLPYSAAKFGARGFSEGLTSELAGTGITATTILPGLMRTGSHQRAQFIGQRNKEYAWFAPSASLPLISMSADTAATRIVTGTLSGKTHVILTPIAKVGMRVHGLSPQLVVKGLGLVSRVLPSGSTEANAGEPLEGRDVKSWKTSLPLKALTFLGDRASKKNQEHPSS